jgi:hypothetical protein
MLPSTKTDEREQWRARILRALEELQADLAGLERHRANDDAEAEGVASTHEV